MTDKRVYADENLQPERVLELVEEIIPVELPDGNWRELLLELFQEAQRQALAACR